MAKDKRKINQILEKTTVDVETGEILEKQQNTSYTIPAEPAYVKLYLRDVLYLKDVPSSLTNFLMALVKRVTYASEEWGNCVVLNSSIREVIKKECGYKTMQSVYNNTSKLIKGEILEELANDVYRLNPYLFGRGEWKDIENIRTQISYSKIEGRTFGINFEYAQKQKQTLEDQLAQVRAKAAQEQQAEVDTLIKAKGAENTNLEGQLNVDDVAYKQA